MERGGEKRARKREEKGVGERGSERERERGKREREDMKKERNEEQISSHQMIPREIFPTTSASRPEQVIKLIKPVRTPTQRAKEC
jgi:hypothetical protein